MSKKWFLILLCTFLTFGFCEKSFAKNTSISLEKLKEISVNQELVVAYNNGKVITHKGGGIRPVLDHLEKHNFKNAYVYDKITGKASALLLAYGGCKKLYTPILSEQAIPILKKYNIEYTYDKTIPYIKTKRTPSGRCIMETAIKDTDDCKEAYKILTNKWKSLYN